MESIEKSKEQLEIENERLRAALKPVLEFDEDAYHKMLNALRAVREAQTIYKEGGAK